MIFHGALQTPRDDEQFPLKSIHNQRDKNLRSEIQRGNEHTIIFRNLSPQNVHRRLAYLFPSGSIYSAGLKGDGWVFGVAASILTECDWCGTARYLGCSGKTGSFSSNSILLSSAHVLKIPMHWLIRLQPASRNVRPWEVLTGKSNSLLLKKQGNNHCVPFLQGWLRYN